MTTEYHIDLKPTDNIGARFQEQPDGTVRVITKDGRIAWSGTRTEADNIIADLVETVAGMIGSGEAGSVPEALNMIVTATMNDWGPE